MMRNSLQPILLGAAFLVLACVIPASNARGVGRYTSQDREWVATVHVTGRKADFKLQAMRGGKAVEFVLVASSGDYEMIGSPHDDELIPAQQYLKIGPCWASLAVSLDGKYLRFEQKDCGIGETGEWDFVKDAVGQLLPSKLLGAWELQALVPSSDAQGPGAVQQKVLLGTSIVYRDRSLAACGSNVVIESIDDRRVTPEEFRAETGVSPEAAGVTQAVEKVVINHRQSGSCFDAFPTPGQVVYLLPNGAALVSFEGVLYRANRQPEAAKKKGPESISTQGAQRTYDSNGN